MLWLAIVLLLSGAPLSGPGWEHVAYIPPNATVYLAPLYTSRTPENQGMVLRVADQIRKKLIGQKSGPLHVDYFDNRKMVPLAIPYSDEQKRHWQARVTFSYDGEISFTWEPNGKKK